MQPGPASKPIRHQNIPTPREYLQPSAALPPALPPTLPPPLPPPLPSAPGITRKRSYLGPKPPPLPPQQPMLSAPARPSSALAVSRADLDSDHVAMIGGPRGLRHISYRLCEKMKVVGRINYGRVADELAVDCTGEASLNDTPPAVEKNLRRRVYDSLNVLVALGIMERDDKDVRWVGFHDAPGLGQNQPLSHSSSTVSGEPIVKSTHSVDSGLKDLDASRREFSTATARIEEKKARLKELKAQNRAISKLAARNRKSSATPSTSDRKANIIGCPFVIVRAPPACQIELDIAPDATSMKFEFSEAFDVHTDLEIIAATRDTL